MTTTATHRNIMTGELVHLIFACPNYVVFTREGSRREVSMDIDEFNANHTALEGQ